MKPEEIYAKLANRELTPAELAKKVSKKPEWIPILVDGMGQKKAEVKYGCAKALRFVVDDRPELLYPLFDHFAEMLDSRNNIFQWEAIYLLAGLVSVDEENKIEALIPRYFARVEGPVMITAANIIKGASEIARARPDLAKRIVGDILRAEKGRYETSECYEIVCGEALKAFDKIYKWLDRPGPVVEFAERHLGSHRNSTHAAAEKLLARHKRWGKSLRCEVRSEPAD
ncbi:MAG: hypothetical protein WEA61_07385 [Anaerolineales bacterium]